jgi:hypothetical protein
MTIKLAYRPALEGNKAYPLDFEYIVTSEGIVRPSVHGDFVTVDGWLCMILRCGACSANFYLTPCADRYTVEVRYGSMADFCPACDTGFTGEEGG